MEKDKDFAVQNVYVLKMVYGSSTMVLTRSTNMVLYIGVSISFCTVGVLNFFP